MSQMVRFPSVTTMFLLLRLLGECPSLGRGPGDEVRVNPFPATLRSSFDIPPLAGDEALDEGQDEPSCRSICDPE